MANYYFDNWTWIGLAFAIDDFGSEALLPDAQFVRAVAFKISEVH